MRHWALALAAVVSSATTGCGGDDSACTPGQSSACSCTNGLSGAQTCEANGTFGACTCEGTIDAQPAIDAQPTIQVKRVFVTSTTYDGNLGGLSGGDAKCNTVAVGAAIGGTWTAWLSDDTTNALDRITDVGPWYLIDETTLVANNKTTLVTTLVNPIGNTELGAIIGAAIVWTGTKSDGSADSLLCANWTTNSSGTGTTGRANQANGSWTSAQTTLCSSSLTGHLYCFEQ